jgi:Metallopeptidase family M24
VAPSLSSCGEQIRKFLRQNELQAWIAWRPDELVMLSGCFGGHGFSSFFKHGAGHHAVFRYHGPAFGVVPGESAEREPGMVITMEPGVHSQERPATARIEDNQLVTESSHETLSRREEPSQT